MPTSNSSTTSDNQAEVINTTKKNMTTNGSTIKSVSKTVINMTNIILYMWQITKDLILMVKNQEPDDSSIALIIEHKDAPATKIVYVDKGRQIDSTLQAFLSSKWGTTKLKDAREIMTDTIKLSSSDKKDKKGNAVGWNIKDNNGKGMKLDTLPRKTKAIMADCLVDALYHDDFIRAQTDPYSLLHYISTDAKWSLWGSPTFDLFSVRIMNNFSKYFNNLSPQEQKNYLPCPNGDYKMGGTLVALLQNPQSYIPYAPIKKANSDRETTFCNTFLYECLIKTDIRLVCKLFPDGLVDAGTMQTNLNKSPMAKNIAIDKVMDIVNAGGLVLATLSGGGEHVGFVVPDSWDFFNPLPAAEKLDLPHGKGTGAIDSNGVYQNPKEVPDRNEYWTWPPIASAGAEKATGITGTRYSMGMGNTDSVQYYHIGWK